MMDGGHTIERCEEVTGSVLRAIFRELRAHEVHLEALVLTTNMVVPGTICAVQASPEISQPRPFAVCAATCRPASRGSRSYPVARIRPTPQSGRARLHDSRGRSHGR